jgi:hypothetical protein
MRAASPGHVSISIYSFIQLKDWVTLVPYQLHTCDFLISSFTMGAQPSTPKPGTEFEVISIGLSRTGTASFSEALRILLEGPVYHGGTQSTMGPPVEIISLIQIITKLFYYPEGTNANEQDALRLIKERFNGYAAVTDAPASGLVPELLKLHPTAKVICTVRDSKAWEKSMRGSPACRQWHSLNVILFQSPACGTFQITLTSYVNNGSHSMETLERTRSPLRHTTGTLHG